MKYRVFMLAFINLSIEVDADDPEAAVEKAYEDMPAEIGALDGGWGQSWSKEEGEYEAYEVTEDTTGKTVWTEGGMWQRVYPDRNSDTPGKPA